MAHFRLSINQPVNLDLSTSGVTAHPCHELPSCQFSACYALPFLTWGQTRDRQTDRRRPPTLNAPTLWDRGRNKLDIQSETAVHNHTTLMLNEVYMVAPSIEYIQSGITPQFFDLCRGALLSPESCFLRGAIVSLDD